MKVDNTAITYSSYLFKVVKSLLDILSNCWLNVNLLTWNLREMCLHTINSYLKYPSIGAEQISQRSRKQIHGFNGFVLQSCFHGLMIDESHPPLTSNWRWFQLMCILPVQIFHKTTLIVLLTHTQHRGQLNIMVLANTRSISSHDSRSLMVK